MHLYSALLCIAVHLWWIESSKGQHLFEIDLFFYNVMTTNTLSIYASLMNERS